MPSFPERLRQLRKSRGLSQADFAKQMNISKSSVNMYERGEREPNFQTLERIADYFNVDMDYLHGKSDVENRSHWIISANSVQKNAPTAPDDRSENHDVLDDVDIAFYGDYKELDEDQKETVRDMVRVMRERRAKRQEK